jgi:hypothetical protein
MDPGFPRPPHQFTQDYEFVHLGAVKGIGHAPRPHAIGETECYIVAAGYFQDAVILLVQRVFHPVMDHPPDQVRSAVAYQRIYSAFGFGPLHNVHGRSAVQGQKVDSIGRLALDDIEQIIDRHAHRRAAFHRCFRDSLIEGKSAHGRGGGGEGLPAHGVDISTDAQIHDRVRAGGNGRPDFAKFGINACAAAVKAHTGAHLGPQACSYPRGGHAVTSMVAGYDNRAPCNTLPYQFRSNSFFFGHLFHCRCDDSLKSFSQLGHTIPFLVLILLASPGPGFSFRTAQKKAHAGPAWTFPSSMNY